MSVMSKKTKLPVYGLVVAALGVLFENENENGFDTSV